MWVRMIRPAFVAGPEPVRAGSEIEVEAHVGKMLIGANKALEIPAPAPAPKRGGTKATPKPASDPAPLREPAADPPPAPDQASVPGSLLISEEE